MRVYYFYCIWITDKHLWWTKIYFNIIFIEPCI